MPAVMGILNVTPDSFYDGGKYFELESALSHAEEMIKDGAIIIDVGGESTRPGADPVDEVEEIRRTIPVIRELRASFDVKISIDTMKPRVAIEAIEAGASLINDVSASLYKIAAEAKVPWVLMHMRGTPQTMQSNTHYDNLIGEVTEFFIQKIELAQSAGVEEIILDPGIGFGKSKEGNLQLLRNISEFKKIGFPVLIGVSNKSFISTIYQEHFGRDFEKPERLPGTLCSEIYSLLNGADIVRAHDVRPIFHALTLLNAFQTLTEN